MAKKPAAKPAAKTPPAPTYPVNPALEAAVIAHAEEDTPRLVYADWLDENGDPDRAAFIRNQVALWDKNPADEDYVDLIEQRLETRVRVNTGRIAPVLPEEVSFYDASLNRHAGIDDSGAAYHRGFPYFCAHAVPRDKRKPNSDPLVQFRDALTNVFKTTTIRGLRVYNPMLRLDQLLRGPIVSQIAALALSNKSHDDAPVPSPFPALANSEVVRQLSWLEVAGLDEQADLDLLASTPFKWLTRFHCRKLTAPAEAISRFFTSQGARRLKRVTLETTPDSASALSALGSLEELHTLELLVPTRADISALSKAKRFPSLSRLALSHVTFGKDGAEMLARLRLPRLTALEIHGGYDGGPLAIENSDIAKLAACPWFKQLTVLHVHHTKISEAGIKDIASSRAAKNLRVLKLGDNAFGKGGLSQIANAGAFPNLTTLHLGSSVEMAPRPNATDVTQFLQQWANPSIRHLNLDYWPVDDAAAGALAANPAFANLRWLKLGLGDGRGRYYRVSLTTKGLRAIAESPHLRNLVYFSAKGTPAEKSAELLLDPDLLPNLAECGIVPPDDPIAKKLAKARPNVRWL